MNLFNKLAKVIAGQKSKTLILEGKAVEITYHGKFVSINPFSFLRDMGFRLQSGLRGDFESSHALGDDLGFLLIDSSEVVPTLSAKAKLTCGVLKVWRSVDSGSKYPISRYDFFLDEAPICSMIRKYEYGAEFSTISEKLAFDFGKPGLIEENKMFWVIKGDDRICLEKFGHTHFYRFMDLLKFQTLLEACS